MPTFPIDSRVEDGRASHFVIVVYFRASTDNGTDTSSPTRNRHVSLANIATAFLTERKSSSRRQTSARRKKRLTVKEKRSDSRGSVICSGATNGGTLAQKHSGNTMDNGIATIMTLTGAPTAGNNKHHTTMVSKHEVLFSSRKTPTLVFRRKLDPFVGSSTQIGADPVLRSITLRQRAQHGGHV